MAVICLCVPKNFSGSNNRPRHHRAINIAKKHRTMKLLILTLCLVFTSGILSAQAGLQHVVRGSKETAQKSGWQPSPGHTQVSIWPGTPPDAQFGPPPTGG